MSVNQSFGISGIDTSNSSTTPLGIGGVATGTWVDVSSYSTVSIMVFSDQPSAVNGLTIQYSTDGSNIDDNDTFTVPASNGQQYSFPLPAKFFRVIYTNGAVAQTVFRLQTKIHATAPKPSAMRTGSGVGQESDAELVLNVNGRMLLVPSAPTTVTIGTSSATVIAANASRKGLVITNTSTLAVLSLNLVAGTAVAGSGIVLYPHDSFYMDEWTFTISQINGIASLAGTTVAIQELS